MKKNRRNFLKHLGLAGVGAAGANILPSCTADKGIEKPNESSSAKNWGTDPEWRKVKYGSWGGPGVPDGPGPMDSVLLKDYAPKSSIIAEETCIPKARFPVIDLHVYHYPARVEGKSQ